MTSRRPARLRAAFLPSTILEPGEQWSWCFIDQIGILIPEVKGETAIAPSPLGG
jgi:hypothetical protein